MFSRARRSRRNRNRRLVVEGYESRQLLAGLGGAWHNPDNALDVSGDALVTPLDSILIANYLDANGPGDVPADAQAGPPFYDTNDDGEVTEIDKHLVDQALSRSGGKNPWHNPRNPLDVTGEGLVSAADSLRIEGYLRAHGPGPVPTDAREGRIYYDTNGDGFVNKVDQALVAAFISPENTAPVAREPGLHTALADQTLTFPRPGVLRTVSDYDTDPLVAVLVSPPSHGVVNLTEDGSFDYTPEPGFVGQDSFSFRANDGRETNNLSNIVTVPIEVRVSPVAPLAVNDEFTTVGDAALKARMGGVLTNDTPNDAEQMVAAIAARPAHGTLSIHSSGDFTYTPAPGFIGTDSFTYRAKDSLPWSPMSNLATVTIRVTSPLQNALDPLDVDGDSSVSAIDAVLVINMLNNAEFWQSAADGESAAMSGVSSFFCDVSGDGHIDPLDAVLVINWLNAGRTGGSEGARAAAGSALVPAAGPPDLNAESVFSLLVDDETAAKRRRNRP